MPLDELRKEIDRLDEEIVRLIGRRAEIARKIGEIKRADGLAAYSPERERAVYDKVASHNGGPLPDACIQAVYREIMSGVIALQKETAVAYLGPPGTFSHMAARDKFGASIRYVERPRIAGVFQAVSEGEADYGVVPIENSSEGGVNATMDLLAENRSLSIISETFLPVGHALLAGVAAEEIAEEHGLRTAARNVQDSTENVTRFFVIGKQTTRPTGRDKTSLVIHIRDEVGALHKMLAPFVDRGIDLTRVESRPSRRRAWKHAFFLDLKGHVDDEPVKSALAEVERQAKEVSVLGSYPSAGS